MKYLLIVVMLMVGTVGWAGMCDNELIAASEGVLPYLSAPSHQEWPDYKMMEIHPVVRPYPSELEIAEAEAKQKSDNVQWLKEKDAAIKRFRDAIRKAKGK